MKITRFKILIFAAIALLSSHRVHAQGTAFSYQGRLTGGGSPVDGSYQLRFALFNAGTGGSQVGNTTTNTPVLVTKGLFTVTLDFGTNAFTGAPRWLEIGVRTNGGGAFRTLGTRQLVTAEPYSLFAARAGAVDWANVSGKPAIGTLTSVGTGPGLTGGPITNSGTISLDAAVVPQLGVANTFTTGNQTILGGGPANRGLVIRGSVGQTGNLQEWQGSAGNVFASVTAAGIFSGNGSGLTNLGVFNQTNVITQTNINASTITSGTLADARLSTNAPLLNRNQTFTGSNTFNGVSFLTNAANTFAGSFSGNGAGLTNLSGVSQTNINAASITSGTLADARLSFNVPLLFRGQTFTGSNTFSGVSLLTNTANTFVGSFTGNGAGLTNVGAAAQTNINASNITSGTLADARLSANVPLLSANQTFAGANTFNGVSSLLNPANSFAGSFNGNGGNLTNLDAADIAFGTLADARLSANAPLLNRNQTFTGSNTFSGVSFLTNAANTFVGSFSGNGAGLTNLSGIAQTNINASNITSGTLADARLTANVPLLSANQTFAGANTFNGVSSLLNPANNFAGSFNGNGGNLTNLDAADVAFGTLADARLSANAPLLNRNQTFTGSNTFSGVSFLTNAANTFVGSFSGNGAGLTNLSGIAQTNINASNITSGTLADARLSTNAPLLDRNQTFTGSNIFSGVSVLTNAANNFAGSFSGNGAGLTNLSGISQSNINAANITSGTLADARLSFNVPLLFRGQTFTGSNTFNGVALLTNTANTIVGAFFGNGAGLSNLVSTGTNFGGTLAGDVTGPAGTTTVARIRGVNVSAVAPVANQHLRFDGASWTPGGVALASDVTGTLGVANGGSGATTPIAARGNLGAAASGANADITSLTGLATPLSAVQGGSGQSSYTTGDLLYASVANTLARRSVGSAGQVLAVSGGVPAWTNANSHSHFGQSWVGTNLYGLSVQSTASNGVGVYGLVVSGASGAGVFGESTATNGTGVYGRAYTGTNAYGVFGEGYSGVVGSGDLYGVNAYSQYGYALFAESGGDSNAPQVALLQDNISDYCRLSIGVSGAPQWQIAVGPGATPEMLFNNSVTNVMSVDFFGNVRAKTFTPSSDRALKEDFASVDPREVLERVTQLPIQTWKFKEDGPTRHIGPMAQDFHAAFQVGPDDKHIATVDADGVALAAIQGLNEVVKEKDARIAALEKRLGQLEKLVAALAEK